MPFTYLLFYKPYDVLSQFGQPAPTEGSAATDEADTHPKTLKPFIPIADVYPVGRLDRDSEGLLLLTNDGRLQHQLTDPRYGHPRTYWVQVERVPNAEAIAQLQNGVTIRDYRTRPAQVQLLPEPPDLPPRHPPIRFRKSVPTAWVQMTLTEGRNRQVRRMTAAVGHPTLRLVRVAIAHLQLGALQPGDWRALSEQEVVQLKRDVNAQANERRDRPHSRRRPRSTSRTKFKK
ncbi:MAG: pseudouridine synthase [Cyanobacteria bacterium J06638_22]